MGIVSIVGLVASVNAMTFAGPRVYFAMARDGVFLPAAAGSIRLQDAVDLDRGAGGVGDRPDPDRQPRRARQLRGVRDHAVRRDRGRRGVRAARARADAPRPFKAIGYPLTPAIFVLFSAVMVVNAIYREPRVTGIGMLLIAAGIPLYLWFTRARRAGTLSASSGARSASAPSLAREQQERRRRAAQEVVEQERRRACALQYRSHHPHVAAIALRLAPRQRVARPTAIRNIAFRSEKIGGLAGGTPKSDASDPAAQQ
jgi:hypothetical protein